MQRNKFSNFISLVVAALAVLTLVKLAHAAPGELEIKLNKNSDLTKETKVTDLRTETRLAPEVEHKNDQIAISASFLNLGRPTISTSDQTSVYNLTSGTAIGFEYAHLFQNSTRITGTLGYEYVQQNAVGSATALHVIPAGVLGEYVFKTSDIIRPFVGAGVMGVVQSQRGVDAQNVTQFDTLPVLSAGADYKTPWGLKLHARIRELLPLSKGANEYYGQIYDLGVVTSL